MIRHDDEPEWTALATDRTGWTGPSQTNFSRLFGFFGFFGTVAHFELLNYDNFGFFGTVAQF